MPAIILHCLISCRRYFAARRQLRCSHAVYCLFSADAITIAAIAVSYAILILFICRHFIIIAAAAIYACHFLYVFTYATVEPLRL